MKTFLKYLMGLIVVDITLFPVEFTFLPGLNLKMLLAACGVLLFAFNCLKAGKVEISRTLLGLIVISGVMSLIGFASVTYNNTNDYVLATYVVSMLVWFFAAYASVWCVKLIHGKIDLSIIGWYLAGVCVSQCILALMIDEIPAVHQFVENYFYSEYVDTAQLRMMHRIYGIGAALDIAGIRFAASIIILTHIYLHIDSPDKKTQLAFWITFALILIVGDMIARTTIVGIGMSLAYMLYVQIGKQVIKASHVAAALFVVIAVFLVRRIALTNAAFYEHLRFGFEGFFNLAESGELRTHSTDILQTMYRWPQDLKTWIIGDGLMEEDGHFYMFTDVGYIRFIYYFGVIGLASFILLYVFATLEGIRMSKGDRVMFILLFLLNMIVWVKVTTDTFVIFAFLLNACILMRDDAEETDNQVIEDQVSDAV